MVKFYDTAWRQWVDPFYDLHYFPRQSFELYRISFPMSTACLIAQLFVGCFAMLYRRRAYYRLRIRVHTTTVCRFSVDEVRVFDSQIHKGRAINHKWQLGCEKYSWGGEAVVIINIKAHFVQSTTHPCRALIAV